MIVAIVATVLILAIAYFQVTQGLFSALVLSVLAIVCAAVALNAYPALASAVLYGRQGAYADATALIALLIVPLIVLRVVFDLLVRDDVMFGLWGNRIGGGALGLLTGTVLVGMVLIAMQMLPFGETVLGYRPYNDALRREQRAAPFYPDEFTVALAKLISGGALSGRDSLTRTHDDLLLEAFCARNTAGKNGSVHAAPDAVSKCTVYEPPADQAPWREDVPPNPLLADESPARVTKVVVLTAAVDQSAADKDGWLRLPGTHFRLVSRPVSATAAAAEEPFADVPAEAADRPKAEAPERQTRSYYPLGCLEPNKEHTSWQFASAPKKEGKLLLAQLFVSHSKAGQPVHWVYRIPDNERPDYLVFRRVAWNEIRKVSKSVPELPEKPEPKGKDDKPAGRTSKTGKKRS